MAFAILRQAKIKSTTKGIMASHNSRESNSNQPNINKEKSHLNWSPAEFEGNCLERIQAKLPAKMRKDAVQAVEFVLTASPEYFEKKGATKAWVDKVCDWSKAEFGDNLVDMKLHLDETTPHFHIVVVPLVDGRLCAKEFTARSEMFRRHDSYAEALAPLGLQRGIPAAETGRKHVPMKDMRRNQRKSQEALQDLPERPQKTGILDIGFQDRQDGYIRRLEQIASAAILSREERVRILSESKKKLAEINLKKSSIDEKERDLQGREHDVSVANRKVVIAREDLIKHARVLGIPEGPRQIPELIEKMRVQEQEAKTKNQPAPAPGHDRQEEPEEPEPKP